MEKTLRKVTMKVFYEYGLDGVGNPKIKAQSIRNINQTAEAVKILGLSKKMAVLFKDGIVETKVVEEHDLDDTEVEV